MDGQREEVRYHHFSHRHSLDYTKLVPQVNPPHCSGCEFTILPGNYYYKCQACQFYLHQVCFNMPQTVTHPSHPSTHSLTLQYSAPPRSIIKCNACEESIHGGFYYRCTSCTDKDDYYYHTLCLAAPLSMKTPSHHHTLNIEFSPVYDFQCDLCDKPSYTGWLYHCNLCEFDAHLSCVLGNRGCKPVQLQSPATDLPGSHLKRDELMDLLTRARGGGEKNQGDQDPSVLVSSEDPTMPSFQLSDACFSIDFQRSLLGSDDDKDHAGVLHEMTIPEEKKLSMDAEEKKSYKPSRTNSKEIMTKEVYTNTAKNSAKLASSATGIDADIWSEMDRESEKRTAHESRGKADSRDHKTRSNAEISGHSCFHSSLFCFFPKQKVNPNTKTEGKLQSPRK